MIANVFSETFVVIIANPNATNRIKHQASNRNMKPIQLLWADWQPEQRGAIAALYQAKIQPEEICTGDTIAIHSTEFICGVSNNADCSTPTTAAEKDFFTELADVLAQVRHRVENPHDGYEIFVQVFRHLIGATTNIRVL